MSRNDETRGSHERKNVLPWPQREVTPASKTQNTKEENHSAGALERKRDRTTGQGVAVNDGVLGSEEGRYQGDYVLNQAGIVQRNVVEKKDRKGKRRS